MTSYKYCDSKVSITSKQTVRKFRLNDIFCIEVSQNPATAFYEEKIMLEICSSYKSSTQWNEPITSEVKTTDPVGYSDS